MGPVGLVTAQGSFHVTATQAARRRTFDADTYPTPSGATRTPHEIAPALLVNRSFTGRTRFNDYHCLAVSGMSACNCGVCHFIIGARLIYSCT